jgi:hypothetical protein
MRFDSFGIRQIPSCGDCYEDGQCSMNCGPRIDSNHDQGEMPTGKTVGLKNDSDTINQSD